MRYAADRKDRTRRAIVEAAGRLFREKGYRAVGVDAVMAAAGLTAGGFYAHFASKAALFAEVVREVTTSFDVLLAEGGLDRLIGAYLGRVHRDTPAEGCPFPALGPDCANAGGDARVTFEARLRAFEAAIAAALPGDDADDRKRALALLAELVGGLVLARAVADPHYSDEILRACRDGACRIGGVERPARRSGAR